MSSPNPENEILYDSPEIRVYKNGKIERQTVTAPASLDPTTGTQSKDIIISTQPPLSARLYLPTPTPSQKLPLLVYFHGGGFVAESAHSLRYHTYLNILASKANVVIVSVEYRLAPEHPIPIPYNDCHEALKWVFAKSDPWLTDYADYDRVFFAGDSAGGNIAHHMGIRFGAECNLDAIILLHPYFGGVEPIGEEKTQMGKAKKMFSDKLWMFATAGSSSGSDDPLFNPELDPDVGKMGCKRVLVSVAENDILRDRGLNYCKILEKSGWHGEVEIMEVKGEEHVFHLVDPTCHNAVAVMDRVVSFINKNKEE